jgi:hypothetical protein
MNNTDDVVCSIELKSDVGLHNNVGLDSISRILSTEGCISYGSDSS